MGSVRGDEALMRWRPGCGISGCLPSDPCSAVENSF